jgi:hypothetical protein
MLQPRSNYNTPFANIKRNKLLDDCHIAPHLADLHNIAMTSHSCQLILAWRILPPCFNYTWPFTRCQTLKILAHNVFSGCSVWNPHFFGPATDPVCAWKLLKLGITQQIPLKWVFRACNKQNWGRTNAFSTWANEHYPANLHGVKTQLRAQSCMSNQNTGPSNWIKRE